MHLFWNFVSHKVHPCRQQKSISADATLALDSFRLKPYGAWLSVPTEQGVGHLLETLQHIVYTDCPEDAWGRKGLHTEIKHNLKIIW